MNLMTQNAMKLKISATPDNDFASCPAQRQHHTHKSPRRDYRRTAIGALIVTTLFGIFDASTAHAADVDELRRAEQREAEQRRQREQTPDVFLQQPTKVDTPAALLDEKPCFVIQTVEIESASAAAFSWMIPMVKEYAGQCIGRQGINIILNRLTNELIQRGYITTRVSVPAQDLTGGTLKVTLIPGIVRAIRFSDGDARGSWLSAFPNRPGDILNLRDIEQGLEQLKRVPSQDVEMKIVPGELPGESDIVITRREAKPWRVALSLDNSGARSTGKLQSAVTLAIDNPLGLNDLFHVSLNNDAEGEAAQRGTRGNSANYSLPFGYWTFSVGANEYRYHQLVKGANQTFMSSGKSAQLEFSVNRVIHRSQVGKTGLQFRVVKKRSASFIEDTEIEVQRKRITSAELALQHRHFFGKAVFDGSFSYRKGMPWLDAQAEAPNAQPNTPTPRYRIWALDANVATPIEWGSMKARYQGAVRAQYAETPLFSSDFFSIGNRYTVRGFDGEQTLAAEHGWLVRNELGFPFAFPGTTATQELYLGLDHGRVSGASASQLSGRALTGTALGLRGGAKGFNYDVSIAWALTKPAAYVTQQAVIAFQLTYQF